MKREFTLKRENEIWETPNGFEFCPADILKKLGLRKKFAYILYVRKTKAIGFTPIELHVEHPNGIWYWEIENITSNNPSCFFGYIIDGYLNKMFPNVDPYINKKLYFKFTKIA